jgi:Leucine-rich repeat (LRR) protein
MIFRYLLIFYILKYTTMLKLIVKYPNDNTEYTVHSFDEIKENCIYLNCSLNYLTSLEPLKKLTQLQHLDFSLNNLTSLKNIENLTQLKNLYCSYNELTSLKGIENLTQLQTLNCSGNKLTSLKGIENLTQLQTLNCSNNKLSSLKGIENLTQLQYLNCYNNKLTSLAGIEILTQLQILYCNNNKITSLEPLRNLTQLQRLGCGNNKLTSLIDIENLTQLQYLNCYNNKLTSLEPLKNLIQLQNLLCYNNNLTSLKGIENLTQLHELHCYNNNLTSLPLSLINCRNLRYISYYDNNIEDLPLPLLRFINRIQQGSLTDINVYNDTQNIHNSSIQLTVRDSINRLSDKFREPFNLDELTKIILEDSVINYKERLIEYMANKEEHSILLLNFAEILWLVWQEINEFEPNKQIEAKKRLNEEIKEADCMCYTGRCNRLINCLVGFSDLVEIKIQDSSQIGNIIVIVKERLGEEYTVDKHKEEVKKELLERGYNLETINEWIEYIQE